MKFKSFRVLSVLVAMACMLAFSGVSFAQTGPDVDTLLPFDGTIGNNVGQYKKVSTKTDEVWDFFTKAKYTREIMTLRKVIQTEKIIPEKRVQEKLSDQEYFVVKEKWQEKYQEPIDRFREEEKLFRVTLDEAPGEKVWRYMKKGAGR
ncbi:MAG: hypothetical protein RB296_01650 [Acidobacteriota bacterium]|jgi:hypothetical protein|nr:hypothetical protein [Acidobacteriota bacterium]